MRFCADRGRASRWHSYERHARAARDATRAEPASRATFWSYRRAAPGSDRLEARSACSFRAHPHLLCRSRYALARVQSLAGADPNDGGCRMRARYDAALVAAETGAPGAAERLYQRPIDRDSAQLRARCLAALSADLPHDRF